MTNISKFFSFVSALGLKLIIIFSLATKRSRRHMEGVRTGGSVRNNFQFPAFSEISLLIRATMAARH